MAFSSVLRPGQRILNIPGIGVSSSRRSVASGASVDWSQWFDHCWIAKGAASLGASYADRVGSQTLAAGAAPSLGVNGWSFDGTKWLDTGIVPSSGGSLVVGFSDGTASGGQVLVGSYGSGNFALGTYWYGDAIYYGNGNSEAAASPKMLSGVLAFSALKVFRNGVHSHTMGGWNQAGTISFYIGGYHTGGSVGFTYSGNISFVGIKATSISDTDVAAASAAVADL